MNRFDSKSFMTDKVYIHIYRVGDGRCIQYGEVQHLCKANNTLCECAVRKDGIIPILMQGQFWTMCFSDKGEILW